MDFNIQIHDILAGFAFVTIVFVVQITVTLRATYVQIAVRKEGHRHLRKISPLLRKDA